MKQKLIKITLVLKLYISFFLDDLIVADKPREINHCEVGKHFTHFNRTHYEPNEGKEKLFPEDSAVREKLIAQIFT